MFLTTPRPLVKALGDELNNLLEKEPSGHQLSRRQRGWLACCLTGILGTHSGGWAKLERASLGTYALAAVSWICRQAKIPWACLLPLGVTVVLRRYASTPGYLVVEDSDKKRGKVTKRMFKAHQLKDKTRGGYSHGPNLVRLWLVTPQVTLPVGVAFDLSDPALTAGKTEDEPLKRPGLPPKNRPRQPTRAPTYPTKQGLARHVLEEFRRAHRPMEVKMVRADALDATHPFMEQAAKLFGTQVLSPLHKNQQGRFRQKLMSIEQYVTPYPGVPQHMRIRGDTDVSVMVSSARRSVDAHHQKRLVMALKYAQETDSRSSVASDLSWRTLDIVQGYTWRWLVEVFCEDGNVPEGWGPLTKPPDEDGSSRSLIRSLRLDHCLRLHPHQLARLENNRPAYPVGSRQQRTRVDYLLACIRALILADNPGEQFNRLCQAVEEGCQLVPSKKPLHNRDLGRLEPTPTLKDRVEMAEVSV